MKTDEQDNQRHGDFCYLLTLLLLVMVCLINTA